MARLPIRFRGLLAVAAVAALTAALAASANAAPLLWTLNGSKETVSTYDTSTNRVVGSPIPAGAGPNSIAITPNGRRAVIVDDASDAVTIIETATRLPIATIPLAGHGERVAISPDGTTAYVTVEGDEHVFVFNVESATPAGSFTVGPTAFPLAFAPNGKSAYVGVEPGDVRVVETATEKVVGAPIPVGGLPTAIAITPNGNTAYVTAFGVNEVAVVSTALGQVVKAIPTTTEATGVAVSPDGSRLYIATKAGVIRVAETANNAIVGSPITVGGEPEEIAITPDGRTAYVAVRGLEQVTPIDLATNKEGTPIDLAGAGVGKLVVAPDQSPTAIFSPPSVTAGVPAEFSGTGSTDPDGSVAGWNWSFGDGAGASGSVVDHTYAGAGTYNASLSVTDNEGCGEAEVFTGRTAYCSGNPLAKVVHPVEAKVPGTGPVCSNRFRFGAVVHNRRNGTVRVQVKLRAVGALFLFGKKIHAVTRKSVKAGSTFLILHARVRVNKRLKKIHHMRVRYRLTFYPAAGCSPTTRHRSVALLRATRKKHHHH